MGGSSQDYKHVVRLVALFGFGLVLFVIARAYLMPPDFGRYGHYRPGALDDNRMEPVKYAGQLACVECHTDVAEVRASGAHARLSCESCHGPLAAHAADPATPPGSKPDPRAVCLPCHSALRSRPKTMPQVVVSEHAPEGACAACHQPHAPGL